MELAERFSILGEIAVIDLDAAMGKGSNIELVCSIAARYPCRVGGGVRDEATMVRLLDAGARTVMVGTMATPDFLSLFPRERLVAALDYKGGVVMTEAWTRNTGLRVAEKVDELSPYVGGFLLTSIDIEGSLSGIDTEEAKALIGSIRATGFSGSLTIAGGVTNASEVAALDALGADAQVGMALYKGILDPANAMAACLHSDRADGLWPTIVCDEAGVALGLVYSDLESLRVAIADRAGVYRSRTRGLWRKGESSGDRQTLVRIDADCDRDTLRMTVRQEGNGFCHRGTKTCFGSVGSDGWGGDESGFSLLTKTTDRRRAEAQNGTAPEGSYTARLFTEPGLLAAKIAEEAEELCDAVGPQRSAEEAADLVYFAAVKLAREGASLADVERVLDRRAMRVTRRPGNAKVPYTEKGNEAWQTGIH